MGKSPLLTTLESKIFGTEHNHLPLDCEVPSKGQVHTCMPIAIDCPTEILVTHSISESVTLIITI